MANHGIIGTTTNAHAELKSAIPENSEHDTCRVKFHNCTPYRVTPYWIDFRGRPIKYPTLKLGQAINIDTYVSHLWFFKAQEANSADETCLNSLGLTKVVAVPEDALKFISDKQYLAILPNDGSRSAIQETVMGVNNNLICSLCKVILKKYPHTSVKVPCKHFTGEARLSASDLDYKSWSSSNYPGAYIYSCTEDTHRRYHAQCRRDVYLVEPFYSLRERCYLTLMDNLNEQHIARLNLPLSLQNDYLQFIAIQRKLDEYNS